jgi:DNA (cytosine-5)-methyltransferase 1
VADSMRGRQSGSRVLGRSGDSKTQGDREEHRAFDAGRDCGLANTHRSGSQPWRTSTSTAGHGDSAVTDGGNLRLADARDGSIQRGQPRAIERELPQGAGSNDSIRPSPLHGFWENADWLHCRDGKWRSVESGTFPLAHGVSARVVRLRGYGNAIVPQVAAEFIQAYLDAARPPPSHPLNRGEG